MKRMWHALANLSGDDDARRLGQHYRLGAWVPHITSTKGPKSSPAQVLEAATSVWSSPINGGVDRFDLVRFHPVEIVRGETLRTVDRGVPGPSVWWGLAP